ncbi:MAG TPA: 50S ribosomal protein L15e [Thermoprotei archaeon]|nr:50S ribosomal protein L15e [Thermoprotei archaeon]
MGMYRYLSETWRTIWSDPEYRRYLTQLRMKWRRERAIQRIERPSRLDRAHALGYRAKQGYIVVRVRVRKGGLSKIPPKLGRRQKRMGISKIKRQLSMQAIAEGRAKRKYPNMRVLGSYYVGEDGKYIWYEVIMRDEHHPAVKSVRS